ncbi:hypothetical protein GCM10010503_00100 [Streptomyces lucensis JCM 4490]|uniref:Uncharacterized protein n=1 Tax=Streptomyces lucensis JCM 4490 TaxID=1306176 RepID=A0A918MIP8_9ACTN|nr:hypothetical protein GCM10010503_00100 [Streptomyces lucensis JCM 4490]
MATTVARAPTHIAWAMSADGLRMNMGRWLLRKSGIPGVADSRIHRCSRTGAGGAVSWGSCVNASLVDTRWFPVRKADPPGRCSGFHPTAEALRTGHRAGTPHRTPGRPPHRAPHGRHTKPRTQNRTAAAQSPARPLRRTPAEDTGQNDDRTTTGGRPDEHPTG